MSSFPGRSGSVARDGFKDNGALDFDDSETDVAQGFGGTALNQHLIRPYSSFLRCSGSMVRDGLTGAGDAKDFRAKDGGEKRQVGLRTATRTNIQLPLIFVPAL